MSESVTGRIHSIETFGAVDGPGIRYVLFMQGCPLKCLYCHNPDSWRDEGGKIVTSQEIADNIKSYKNYFKKGGVTISGGEPLLQIDFVYDLVKRCKKIGLHTALDTAGSVSIQLSKKVIDECDLILLDIKALDNAVCKELTGKYNDNTIDTLKYCEMTDKPVWLRHVLVPGITLKDEMLEELADFLKDFKCIKKVELMPFHKMGEFKWKELGMDYKLYETSEPKADEINRAKEIFKSRNLPLN